MRKALTCCSVFVLLATSASVSADDPHPHHRPFADFAKGGKNVDYAVAGVTVSPGHPRTVQITNQTHPQGDGNWSSIDVWVNGRYDVGGRGIDPRGYPDREEHTSYSPSAKASYALVLGTPGTYSVKIGCDNGNATAGTCTAVVE